MGSIYRNSELWRNPIARIFLLALVAFTAITSASLLRSDTQAQPQTQSTIILNLASGSHCIPETDGTVTITANIVPPAPESATFGLGHDGRANNFDDYTASLPIFAKDATTTTFRVRADHDESDEPHEDFELSVNGTFPATGRSAESYAPIKLVIIDDDTSGQQPPRCVTLTASDYTPDEGDTVTITATLDQAAGSGGECRSRWSPTAKAQPPVPITA